MYDSYLYQSLIPWVHYVPVKSDMSDLVEKAAFVLDAENEKVVRGIINAANQWCISHISNINAAHQMMWTLIDYVELLNASDLKWQDKWGQIKLEKGYDTSFLVHTDE